MSDILVQSSSPFPLVLPASQKYSLEKWGHWRKNLLSPKKLEKWGHWRKNLLAPQKYSLEKWGHWRENLLAPQKRQTAAEKGGKKI